MTSRTVDIRCATCRRYLFSVQPRDEIPNGSVCDECRYGKKKQGREKLKQRRKGKQ